MKQIFMNNGSLRNGWWILGFAALIVASQPLYRFLKGWMTELGATEPVLELISPMLIVLITFICLKFRREPLSSVGLKFNRKWLKHFSIGTLLGGAAIALTAGLIVLIGGVSFSLNAEANVNLLAYGLYLFLIGSFLEELLHRGFIFQRLIDGIGEWPAQLLIASLFAFGHWGNPGMEGSTMLISSLDLFLGSLILGLAYIRTKSLALPIGLHLGWNWFQGNVLGFGVSGHEKTGVLLPEFHGLPQWLTGGDFGPEASVISLVVSCFALVYIWVWPGSQSQLDDEALILDNTKKSTPLTIAS